jgi:hypothetical protein
MLESQAWESRNTINRSQSDKTEPVDEMWRKGNNVSCSVSALQARRPHVEQVPFRSSTGEKEKPWGLFSRAQLVPGPVPVDFSPGGLQAA